MASLFSISFSHFYRYRRRKRQTARDKSASTELCLKQAGNPGTQNRRMIWYAAMCRSSHYNCTLPPPPIPSIITASSSPQKPYLVLITRSWLHWRPEKGLGCIHKFRKTLGYALALLLGYFRGQKQELKEQEDCAGNNLWGHKVLIYIEHHSVWPLVGIGTPPHL
jgi:hypothetical protein